MLYKLKLSKVRTTIPTIGFNVETVQDKNINITTWDMGGRDKIRGLYHHYYPLMNAVIFMVDSNDRDRTGDAAAELAKMLSEPQLSGHPLLVMCNKQDLPNAMSVSEVTDKLKLHAVKGRQWHIQACCATSGDGVREGIDWLLSALLQPNARESKANTVSGPVVATT